MRRVPLILMIGLISLSSAAQSVERADSLAADEKHREAVAEYRLVLAAEPDDGRAWYGLGRSLQSLGELAEALDAFDRAGEIGFQPGGVLFRKGTIHLEMGELDQAREWLAKAAEQGVPVYNLAKTLPSFARVADDLEFQAFIAGLAPCSSSWYRQFDFWIGDWDVYDPSGQKVGQNRIESILGGCVLFESWTGGTGGEGRSFNRFDPETNSWNQHWVFNTGTELVMTGSFRDGRMILETREGVSPRQRWTWYEMAPRTVRQMAEQTTDGETWTIIWDSIYIPEGTDWETVALD